MINKIVFFLYGFLFASLFCLHFWLQHKEQLLLDEQKVVDDRAILNQDIAKHKEFVRTLICKKKKEL